MSDQYLSFALVAGMITVGVWAGWYSDLLRVNRLVASLRIRLFLAATPLFCLAIIGWMIDHFAARAVQQEAVYFVFYMGLGAVWVRVSLHAVSYLGISVRDDALERRNSPAALACIAALFSLSFCYAGANVGEGPGPEAVIGSAALATSSFLLLWLVFELLTSVSERITIDRDICSAIRFAGFLLAAGLLFGAGAAGDWHEGDVIASFLRFAWPVILLVAFAASVERLARKSAHAFTAVSLALIYVMSAAFYLYCRATAH